MKALIKEYISNIKNKDADTFWITIDILVIVMIAYIEFTH